MAKNRQPEKPVEEEEEVSSEEGSESESETESEPEPGLTQDSKKGSFPTPATQQKSQPQPSAKAPQKQPDSSSSGEEETESDSESESDGPGPNINEAQKSNTGAGKPTSKPNAAEPPPATPTKSTVTKRTAEEKATEGRDAKKTKKEPEPTPETSEKRSLFQRLWSEEDEIVILKGMIDYVSKKKADPMADLNAFHDFIKKNLHVDVSRTQLQDKIRRLKKKYVSNKRNLSKPHEQKAYELSKTIWGGNEAGGEKVAKANGGSAAVRKASSKRTGIVATDTEEDEVNNAAVVTGDVEKLLLGRSVNSGGGVSVEERIMKLGAEFYEAGKGLEGENEWKKLRHEEFEVYLRQLEMKAAQTKLVLDALKSPITDTSH